MKVITGIVVGLAAVCCTTSAAMAGMGETIREVVHEKALQLREQRAADETHRKLEESRGALESLPQGAEDIENLGGGWVRFSLDNKVFLFYKKTVYRQGYAAITQVQ